MVVPLVARGRTFGAASFVSGPSGRRYGPVDLELAEDLARRAALAADNARLYREQAHIAQTLQQSLLPPSLPVIPGLKVVAPSTPRDVVGLLAACFHFAYGVWLFACKWGFTPGRQAQKRLFWASMALFAALSGAGLASLRSFGTAPIERTPEELIRER